MAVIDLTKFLIIYVLEKEIHHLFVHLLLFFIVGLGGFLFFIVFLVLVCWVIDGFYFTLLFWDEDAVPTDEEVVAVKVGTAYLGC